MKTVIIFFTLLIAVMIAFHHALQNGEFLQYIDEHPDATWAPRVTYNIGQGYYMLQNLDEATTYFIRVAQRYPNLPIGDNAYFAYLQCQDDKGTVNRGVLIEGYNAYLEKYPNGLHAETAKGRVDNYLVSGGR